MRFDSAKEMLDTITSGVDLYNPICETYVFVYNTEDSICVYSNIDKETANKLATETHNWSECLGMYGSAIYDSVEYLENHGKKTKAAEYLGRTNIQWCEEMYSKAGWISTKKYAA